MAADRDRQTFHSFIDHALEGLDGWGKLDFLTQSILVFMLRTAKWDEAVFRTTLVSLAEYVGLRPETLALKLDELQCARYVSYDFPRGHEGTVILCVYVDVMKTTEEQRDLIAAAHDRVLAQRQKAAARAARRRSRG